MKINILLKKKYKLEEFNKIKEESSWASSILEKLAISEVPKKFTYKIVIEENQIEGHFEA